MILREKMFAFYVESYDKLGFGGVTDIPSPLGQYHLVKQSQKIRLKNIKKLKKSIDKKPKVCGRFY